MNAQHRAVTVRSVARAVAALFLGGTIGFPMGLALSQGAPQMRVQVLLQHRATDIPLPASLEVRDDRWDPGAETGEHEHPGPVILVVVDGELVEETAGRSATSSARATPIGDRAGKAQRQERWRDDCARPGDSLRSSAVNVSPAR
ncbi:MAG: hypothetical protein HC869_13360 [Rhodospirillales bacterium]|nr:hypothetical protein [Rhodospirillales bacterium]